MAGKITTIKLSEGTKDRLNHLKVYQRETYDEILNKVLDILNLAIHDPERARSKLILIGKQSRRKNKVGKSSVNKTQIKHNTS